MTGDCQLIWSPTLEIELHHNVVVAWEIPWERTYFDCCCAASPGCPHANPLFTPPLYTCGGDRSGIVIHHFSRAEALR